MKHTALFTLTLLLATAAAQEGPAKEAQAPQMDAVAKKVMDAWKKKLYNLGAAGVKKCSFTINATVTQAGQVTKGVGKYKNDGAKGSLAWDNAMLGAQLAQEGWNADTFDMSLDPDGEQKVLAGAKLTGTATGTGTVIEIAGAPVKNSMQWKRMYFDKAGVNTSIAASVITPAGESDVEFSMTYEKMGDKYLNNGWAFEMEIPGMGKISQKATMTFVNVGGFHVASKVKAVGTGPMGESVKELEFTDYKLNDDVK